jgi:AcrR family transcriptional regulator
MAGAMKPGRPRDPALDHAVLTIAGELLGEHGYRALTMAAVAARAGTSKTAIYRRWPSKAALVIAVMAARLPAPTTPDTGSPSGNLVEASRRLAESLADPAVRHGITGLLAEAATDASITTQIHEQLIQPQLAAAGTAMAQAHAEGLLPAWLTANLIADVVTGTVLQRVLIRGETPDAVFFESLARLLTTTTAPTPPQS